jgi:alpha-mannosidase
MADTLTLHVVSHTHWDREWYLTWQQFRHRSIRMIDRLLDLLEADAGYRCFTFDGQVLALKDYLEIRPENAERIAARVRDGQLLIGPWYTQPNVYMVGAESMIRNLLLGRREAAKLGPVMNVCYLPDAFGFTAQLPQLMDGFGIPDIMVARGVPAGSRTVFRWVGADGTACHAFNMIGSYVNAGHLPSHREDRDEIMDSTPIRRRGLASRIAELLKRLEPRSTSPHILLMNGFDHQFPQADLPRILEMINADNPRLEAVHSSLPRYIAAVKGHHERNGLPYDECRGELRDPREGCILPGSQMTRPDVKVANSRVESLFESWMEPAAVYAWLCGAEYPRAEIAQAWEYLLQNHAHDSMACSSIDPVHRQVMTRFEWADELGEEIASDGLQAVCGAVDLPGAGGTGMPVLAVFNPLSWERGGVVCARIDIPRALRIDCFQIMDGASPLPFAVRARHATTVTRYNSFSGLPAWIPVERWDVDILVSRVPGHGYAALSLAPAAVPPCFPGSLFTDGRTMENEHSRVRINGDGTLDVTDKATGGTYAGLMSFDDCGDSGNGFEQMNPLADRICRSLGARAEISVVQDSAVAAAMRVRLVMEVPEGLSPDGTGRSERTVPCVITSTVTLRRGNGRVEIHTAVENTARDHRLRVLFPTGIDTGTAWAEEPFDVVARSIRLPDPGSAPPAGTQTDLSDEKPSRIQPQLSFVDVSDGGRGLMIANRGIYAYEALEDDGRTIALTLLRCTGKLYRYGYGDSEDLDIPGAQCRGLYELDYALIPHAGSWERGYRAAYEFTRPMRAVLRRTPEDAALAPLPADLSVPVPACAPAALPARHSFVQLEGESLVVTAVKGSEAGGSVVLRVLNTSPGAREGRIRLAVPGRRVKSAHRVRLDETRLSPLAPAPDGWIPLSLEGKAAATVEVVMD